MVVQKLGQNKDVSLYPLEEEDFLVELYMCEVKDIKTEVVEGFMMLLRHPVNMIDSISVITSPSSNRWYR